MKMQKDELIRWKCVEIICRQMEFQLIAALGSIHLAFYAAFVLRHVHFWVAQPYTFKKD